jgi:hypothetical protein
MRRRRPTPGSPAAAVGRRWGSRLSPPTPEVGPCCSPLAPRNLSLRVDPERHRFTCGRHGNLLVGRHSGGDRRRRSPDHPDVNQQAAYGETRPLGE